MVDATAASGTAEATESSPGNPGRPGMGPAYKPSPAVGDQLSAPGIDESEFVEQAVAFGVVTCSAGGYDVCRGVVAAGSEGHDMIRAQGEDPPEIVD